MGACSSKPKTTEFEESAEPAKNTGDVSADRSIDAVDTTQVSHLNEPVKEDQGSADVGTEAVQETRSLVAIKGEEPLVKESQSATERVSSIAEPESRAVEIDVGDSQKADVGDGCEEVSEKVTALDDGGGGDPDKIFEDKAIVLDEVSSSVVGKGDTYVDKAVSTDEEKALESSAKGDTYVSKAVSADEEKALESSDKGIGSAIAQDEDLKKLQDIEGLESPVIGVVHSAEPIHVDDVSRSVGPVMPETAVLVDPEVSEPIHVDDVQVNVGLAIPETMVHVDSKVDEPIHVDDAPGNTGSATSETMAHVDPKVSGSLNRIETNVSTGSNTGEDDTPPTEEVANLSSIPPQEAPEEKEEATHDTSKGCPVLVSSSDDGVNLKTRANDAKGEEIPVASADAQDETRVEDTTKPEDTAKPETAEGAEEVSEESKFESQEENLLEESARESCVEVTENEGNAVVLHEPEPEPPKVHESIDAETSVEPKVGTMVEQANEVEGESIVDELKASDVQPQALAAEESAEDSKPDEAIVEPNVGIDRGEKFVKPHIEQASSNELKLESVDAGGLEPSDQKGIKALKDGDVVFEDASDVPLKVESRTIESGDKPDS